jgi:LEA14-like dessication related protein
MKKILLFLTLPIIISGCQTVQNITDNISKPSLSISDVRVTDFAFDEIELTYDVEVVNPNPVALQMLGYDYDFNINGNDFIKGDADKELRIESSGASTFQIPMRLNFTELYNLFSGLKGKDEADYTLLANLNFKLPVLGETTIPLEKNGAIPMLKLPKISVSNLNVEDVNFSRANLMLNLKVDNPNGFGLLVNALSYNLNVNGRNWVDGSNKQQITINQNNSNQLSIPISVNITEISTSVIQLLNNSQEVDFNLNGSFNFGADHPLFKDATTTFSFDEAGELPIIR